jgi:cobalt/nickel transport system permease protein
VTVIDRTIAEISTHVQRLLRNEQTSQKSGFLQAVHPSVKIVGLFALIVVAVSLDAWQPQLLLLALVAGLAISSRVSPLTLARRVWIVPVASLLIVAPQLVLIPGDPVAGPITDVGVGYVVTFVLRVAVSVALLSLLIVTTRFADVLSGLRRLGVPAVGVTLIAVTHRYLLVFFNELARVVRARRSRTIADRGGGQTWRETGSMLGSFLLRAFERGERVQRSARARGGTTMTPYSDDSRLSRADAGFAVVTVTVVLARVGVALA